MSVSSTELIGPLNTVEQKFAPRSLWTAGDRTLLQRHPRVAVVGTRKPSEEGERRTRKLVKELVKHRAIIVSGLAAGVDTIAHTEAIAQGGRTIAVIGTPFELRFASLLAYCPRGEGEHHEKSRQLMRRSAEHAGVVRWYLIGLALGPLHGRQGAHARNHRRLRRPLGCCCSRRARQETS